MLEGVDVSHWQTRTPALAGRSFLIAKATEGTTRDPMVAEHVAAARAADVVPGLYHWSRSDVSMAAQVDAFLEVAAELGIRWLAFDVEGEHAWSFSALRSAIARVHGAGEDVGLYMSRSRFVDAGQDWDWVADWGPDPPSIPWDLWQYRGSPLDLDRYDGTLAELRTLAKQEDPPMPGLQFRFLDRVSGLATVQGSGHALIRVDTGDHVGAPDGQVREVAGKIVLTAPAPTSTPFPAGTRGYLVGNVPGLTPDQSIAAMVLEGDVLFVPDPQADCSAVQHELELANSRIHDAVVRLGGTPT